MIKNIIFDLDGTLLNTLDDLANSCNHALASVGLPTHPAEAYKHFIGSGRDMLVRRAMGEHYTQELFTKVISINDAHYIAHGEDCTAPYDGILPLLDRLKERGIACAVVSNKPHQFCEILVPKYFGDTIALALGCIDGTPPKPNPALVFKALEVLGADPRETLYVGDSGVDMQTAKNSGLPACGVLWGFRDREELQKNGADYFCETIEELEHLIFSAR